MNKSAKKPSSILFYLAGAFLIIMGIVLSLVVKSTNDANNSLRDNFVPVTATVTNKIYDSEMKNIKEIYVTYTVNDKEYDNTRIILESPVPYVNSKLTVYYDPQNPVVVLTEASKSSMTLANAAGLALVILGFVVMIIGGSRYKSRAEKKIEERFRPYDEYEGGYTEKAGTLFDKEIDPAELKLEKKKHKSRAQKKQDMFFDHFN